MTRPEPQDGAERSAPRFGAFTGVFRPVFLTILGAMLYLREGWVVGNAGLVGALGVIVVAYVIIGTTAASLATIATNVRVRPGGAFAIIATALGLEAGGAIGIPLYVAQALSAAMYLYAFAEAWQVWFPSHPLGAVAGVGFLAVGALAAISAQLAFRAQAVMLVVVAAALSSMFLGLLTAEPTSIEWFGTFPDASPLQTFAIFFPAATGIMVGVGMSGSLLDPRRAIPAGTLGAWGLTFFVYAAAAVFYAWVADVPELIEHKTVVLDRALVGPLVHVGLLTSTLMAALSSLVAAPRLLQAMAAHGAVPAARWLAREARPDDPRNASLLTAGIVAVALSSGSLDAIAPIVTSFFIVTYLAINRVVSTEYGLGMISFRPTLRVWPALPITGVVVCAMALTLASPFGGLPELLFVVGIYVVLSRRRLETPWETVSSGLAVRVADWAARLAAPIERSVRAWKPDLLVPVSARAEVEALTPLLRAATRRVGSVKWVATRPDLEGDLNALARRWTTEGAYTTATSVDAPFADAARYAVDLLRGSFFPPNLVVIDGTHHELADVQRVLDLCRDRGVGLLLFYPHPDGGLGARASITTWLSSRYPAWELELHMTNLDVPLLLALLLCEATGARLSLCTVVKEPRATARAHVFLRQLVEMARLPRDTATHAVHGDFVEKIAAAPPADVHLFGMPATLDPARVHEIRAAARGAVLFVLDSGDASALA
jgi:hypothetical protein